MEIELKLKMENAQNIVLYFIRNSNNSNQAVILKSKKHTHTKKCTCVCVWSPIRILCTCDEIRTNILQLWRLLIIKSRCTDWYGKTWKCETTKEAKRAKNTTAWRTDYGEYELDRHGNIYTLRHTHIHAAEGSGIDWRVVLVVVVLWSCAKNFHTTINDRLYKYTNIMSAKISKLFRAISVAKSKSQRYKSQ